MWHLYKDLLLVLIAHAKDQEQWLLVHKGSEMIADLQYIIDTEGPDHD